MLGFSAWLLCLASRLAFSLLLVAYPCPCSIFRSTLADMSAGTRFLRLIPEEKPEIVNNTGEIKVLERCVTAR
jgi:hypothetical protein